MSRRKIETYEILRVEEKRKGEYPVQLRAIPFDEIRDVDAPDGTYSRWNGCLFLPKRKRGVKFNVVYTQIFSKEL